jgi:hypothetical protein
LAQRRKIARVCVLFKAYTGEQAWKAISLRKTRSLSTDHDSKIRSRKQKTDIRKYSFVNRTIGPYNSGTNNLQMLKKLSPVNQEILGKRLGK